MVLDAMRHCVDSLDYLRLLKNQSVFNFCAIPATMAMATLALCFGNEAMFQRNIKIRKAAAATVRSTAQPHRCSSLTDIPSTQLILNSTNPRDVAYLFRTYARSIHSKCLITDPNFIAISIACGKIEVWCEHHYPSFVSIPSSSSASQVYDEKDLRAKVVVMDQKRDAELKLGINGHGNGHRNGKGGAANARALTSSRENEVPWQMMLIGISALGVLIILVGGIVW